MVGQKILLSKIDALVENKTFPQSVVLVGQPGSGRKTLIKYICKKLGSVEATYGIGIDAIRQMIIESYKVATPMVYVLPDADKMSQAAKNALLKITEEPPQRAYFIITVSDVNSLLATIRSRAYIFYMDPYNSNEIFSYYSSKKEYSEDDAGIVRELCETPGEVDTLVSMGVREFYEYALKVVDNIAEVSGSNSFKIAQKIKLKETDADKYDLRLFWKAFMSICSSRLREEPIKYADAIKITSKYIQELRITGINKQSTFDLWLLDIREAWRED